MCTWGRRGGGALRNTTGARIMCWMLGAHYKKVMVTLTYITWLSQLHICSLDTWHWTGVCIECVVSNGCSNGWLSSSSQPTSVECAWKVCCFWITHLSQCANPFTLEMPIRACTLIRTMGEIQFCNWNWPNCSEKMICWHKTLFSLGACNSDNHHKVKIIISLLLIYKYGKAEGTNRQWCQCACVATVSWKWELIV